MDRGTDQDSGGHDTGSVPQGLGLALELMPDACVAVDGDGRIIAVNHEVEDLFGYSHHELVGQRVEVLIPERFRHQHRLYRTSYIAEPRRRTMGSGLRLYGRRQDATEFPVDISLAPVRRVEGPIVVAAIRDASQSVAAAAASAQLAAIVRGSRDAILTMTTAGVVTTWNPGAEEVLGTPAEEAVGSHIGRWIFPEESPVLEELMGLVTAHGHAPARDTIWRAAGGKGIDVAISMSPVLAENGELQGYSVLVRDITERKAAENTHRRQEEWQAATAEIRMASLSDSSLDETFELICARAFQLAGGIGAAIVTAYEGGLGIAATAGERRDDLVSELAMMTIASGETTRASWDLSFSGAGDPVEATSSPISSPLAASGSPGALVVIFPTGVEPGDEMHKLVGMLAGQATVAIELHEARDARQRLLLTEDRERIARDLHDLVIQRLFATGMSLESVQHLVSNDTVARRLSEATAELDTTIREVRTTIFALQSRTESGEGLRGQLVRLVSAATENLGFHPSLQFDGPVDLVADDLRHSAVAVAREALSNVARHARASSATVFVAARDGFSIVVEDNGVGLPETYRESGLANLRSRAEEFGGSLVLENRADGGTKVVWQVPSL